MEKEEIQKLSRGIYENLSCHFLSDALEDLSKLVEATAQWELGEEMNRLNTSYGYMLQYLSQGILDPQRSNILKQIVKDAFILTDKAVIALLTNLSSDIFYVRHQASKTISLGSLVNEYGIEINKLSLINSVEQDNSDNTAARNIVTRCEQLESDIFNKVWSTYPTPAADV